MTVFKVGENALAEFMDVLIEWETAIVEEIWTNRPMKRMSVQKREEYENASECYIFRQPFEKDKQKGPKVRDNDHITGFFIGAVHREYNLERPVSFRISVFFHNFRGYDAHLMVHKFGKRPDREIKVIGQNMEKYLQVKWGKNIIFCESLQFLPASLEQLTASLGKTGRGNFDNLHEVISQIYPGSDAAR